MLFSKCCLYQILRSTNLSNFVFSPWYNDREPITYVLKWRGKSQLRHLWWFQIEKNALVSMVYTKIFERCEGYCETHWWINYQVCLNSRHCNFWSPPNTDIHPVLLDQLRLSQRLYSIYPVFYYGNGNAMISIVCNTIYIYIAMWFYQTNPIVNTCTYLLSVQWQISM